MQPYEPGWELQATLFHGQCSFGVDVLEESDHALERKAPPGDNRPEEDEKVEYMEGEVDVWASGMRAGMRMMAFESVDPLFEEEAISLAWVEAAQKLSV